MFDVYIQSQKVNPARRLLLVGSLVASIAGTVGGLAFLWVAGKMNISRVDPPTIEFMMVQLTEEEPPPPPPPPPPPAGDDAEDTVEEEEIPEEEIPIEEELTQPTEVKDEIPKEKKGSKGSKVPGVPGGVPVPEFRRGSNRCRGS